MPIARRTAVLLLLWIGCLPVRAAAQQFHWAKSIQGKASFRGSGAAVTHDDSGHVYWLLNFSDTADLDPGFPIEEARALKGSGIALLKLDPKGRLIWIRTLGNDSADARGYALKSAPGGDLFLTGTFRGTIDLDPGPDSAFTVSGYNGDAFVLRLSPEGRLRWSRRITTRPSSFLYNEVPVWMPALAVGRSGDCFVGGNFTDSVCFSPDSAGYCFTAQIWTSYVMRLDTNGQLRWLKLLAAAEGTSLNDLATDPQDHVYATGGYRGKINFNPPGYTDTTHAQRGAAYVWALDRDGAYRWYHHWRVDSPWAGTAIAADRYGHLYAAGGNGIRSTPDIGEGQHSFVARLDTAGVQRWIRTSGGASAGHEAFSLRTDDTGAAWIAGTFVDSLRFGPDLSLRDSVPGSNRNIFLARIDTAGQFHDARQAGEAAGAGAGMLDLDHGSYYLTGSYDDPQNDFDPGPGIYTLFLRGREDAFLLKLGQAGLPYPADSSSGTLSMCANERRLLSVPPVHGASGYYWQVPPTMTIESGQGTSEVQLKVRDSSGAVTVTPFNSSDSSEPAVLRLIVARREPASPDTLYGPSRLCSGQTIVDSASHVPDATGYRWIVPAGWRGQSVSRVLRAEPVPGRGTVSVVAVNGCGVSAPRSIGVEVSPLPSLQVGILPDTVLCPETFLTLTASGADTIRWSDGVTNGSDFIPPRSHVYTVTGTDRNGCSTKRQAAIRLRPALNILRQPANQIIIEGSTALLTLKATDSSLYQWQADAGNGFADLEEGPVFTGTRTDSLYVGNVRPRVRDWTYRCVVRSRWCSRVSETASLVVRAGADCGTPKTELAPNPARKACVLTTEDDLDGFAYTVRNALGQVVMTGRLSGRSTRIDISSLACGMYLLSVHHGCYTPVKLVKE